MDHGQSFNHSSEKSKGNWIRMQLRCSKRNKLLCCFVVILLTITLANAGRVPDIKTKGEPPIKKSRTGDVNRGTDQEGIKTTRTDVGESTAANVAEALSQGASMARFLEKIKIEREQVAKAPTRVSHQKNQEPSRIAHTLDISSVFSAVKPDEGEPKAGTSAQAKEEEIRTDELGAFIGKQEEIKAKIIGNPRPFVVTFNFEQIKQKLTELFQRDPVIQQHQNNLYWEQFIEEYVKVGTIIQISAVKNPGNPTANFPSSGKFVKCVGLKKDETNPIYQLFGTKGTHDLSGWLGMKYKGVTKNVDLGTEYEPFWGRRIQQVQDFKEGQTTGSQAEGGTNKDSRTKTDSGAALQKPFPIDFTFQYVKDKQTNDIPSVFSAVKPDEGEPKAGTSAQAKEEEIRTDELAAFIDKQEAIKHKKIDSLAEAINDYDSGMVLVSHTLCPISQAAQEIWVCKNHTVTDDSASKSKKPTRRRQNNG